MNKGILGVMVSSLLVAGGLQAGCFDSLCGDFMIGAEAIYLRPTVCDTNYAIPDPLGYTATTSQTPPFNGTPAALPQGAQKSVNADYNWGFRVMAGYIFEGGCSDVQLQYTWLHTRDSGAYVEGEGFGGIWPTFGHPRYLSGKPGFVGVEQVPGPLFNPIENVNLIGVQLPAFARSTVRWDYDAVDLTMGSRSIKGCDLWVRGYVGLHYANILNRTTVEYQGTFNPGQGQIGNVASATTLQSVINNKRNTWGVGPKLGVQASYRIGCGLGVGAAFGVALIAGESDANFIQEDLVTILGELASVPIPPTVIAQTLNTRYSSSLRVVPVVNARLGLNYEYRCGNCYAFFGEIGYEFTSYINAFARTTFNDDGGTSSQNCYSFNLDGLYLKGVLAF